ncbi:hypothetical protein Cgig2_031190 [Carnegiea gigantea]|uniref:Uncharacterized protein n=1 Tax=Carnegiea gigantea TaxID=171969 RepID=A0A9Q1KQJ7_9CARY|nr:hypothetical protein Cgig2_031190 [Carnegiea gigantea]
MTSVEGNDDDSGDEDFNESREQAYTNANTSLDAEDFSSDSNDDIMELGREIIYSEEDSNLVMNKMSKAFKTEVLWTRNRDGNGELIYTILKDIRKLAGGSFVKIFEIKQAWEEELVQTMWEKGNLSELDPPFLQVKQGKAEELKRKDSQLLLHAGS